MKNPLLYKDFYKADHRSQYPGNTTLIYSNLTARKSRTDANYVVFFGLQYFIKEYLLKRFQEDFFSLSETEAVTKYRRMLFFALGNPFPVTHLRYLHRLGYLPIEIKALPEGTRVPIGVPMLTIQNTLPEFFWLTNYLETILSCVLWGAITSATTADLYKKLLLSAAERTGGDKGFVQFQAHDFSFRGMFGLEAAAISGAAHLLSFWGTDTIPAIEFLETYYGADVEKEMVGTSVYATEHSVMCAGGKENEFETYKRLITQVYPKGIVSIVSDTWDLWNVLVNHIPKLKDDILAREGKVVIRPDSGDPANILCGVQSETTHGSTDYKYWAPRKGVIELLWDIFGGKVNEKGYRELDPHIGAIYGDSITPERAQDICSRLEKKGFASTNIVFGVGSYTYQYVTRDTYGMAVKATYAEIEGMPVNMFKDPITDNGAAKKSAKGLLAVQYENEQLILKQEADTVTPSELQTVFVDGLLKRETNLQEIRSIL